MDHGIWYWPFFITEKKEVIVEVILTLFIPLSLSNLSPN